MRHVVMFSSGVASWGAARRVADTHGTENLTLLFADTQIEDEDNYRFLLDASADTGAELACIADGRDPWQVFFDVRFLGNTKADPCSRILKRELMREWLEANRDPDDTICYVGYDWTEPHRAKNARRFWSPWQVEFPLMAPPLLMKEEWRDECRRRGFEPPRLYAMGFGHANCGGFCVKAGHGQFAKLLAALPDRYREHEEREEQFRQMVGKDVSILTDRAGGGPKRPLTMRAFRERVEAGWKPDLFDVGGCACMEEPA